jgi:hypothetical protein
MGFDDVETMCQYLIHRGREPSRVPFKGSVHMKLALQEPVRSAICHQLLFTFRDYDLVRNTGSTAEERKQRNRPLQSRAPRFCP